MTAYLRKVTSRDSTHTACTLMCVAVCANFGVCMPTNTSIDTKTEQCVCVCVLTTQFQVGVISTHTDTHGIRYDPLATCTSIRIHCTCLYKFLRVYMYMSCICIIHAFLVYTHTMM